MDDEPGQVRFAVGLPNVGVFGEPVVLVDLARRAEQAGWDGVFVWDHVLYHDPDWPVADPTVTIAAVAASTARVRLGVLMTAVARRRVGKLAREMASLDVLSGGRLVVGAGLGSMPTEFSRFGEPDDPSVRARKLDETLAALAALWAGDAVTMHGAHVHIDDVQMTPVPVQRPRPPVWCAGKWPARAPLRRGARWDGVMPTHAGYGKGTTMPPETLAEIVGFVREQRAAWVAAGHPSPVAGIAPGGQPAFGAERFDVVVEGSTEGSSADRDWSAVQPYACAGLTWWVEALGWWRGGLEAAQRRIDAGPPRQN